MNTSDNDTKEIPKPESEDSEEVLRKRYSREDRRDEALDAIYGVANKGYN